MRDEMTGMRAECIQELSSELLTAAGKVMLRHGDDPQSLVLLTAGFAMAINEINKNIDPRMRSAIVAMIS